MDRRSPDASATSSDVSSNGRYHIPRHSSSSQSRPRPDYSSEIVREALEHLASIDLTELCHEAKVEHCRATRDLSSCGRYVQNILTSCGHASLCAECSQRCDVCPICRTPIPKSGCRLRLRLYNKCIEAGLIYKRHNDKFQEKELDGKHVLADVQRLYSLFDVALENNLVSLICHYISDVCMDESAVSSDPVHAFLLDEMVVKDWCKQKLKAIISDLSTIYAVEAEELETELASILKYGSHLTGLSNVLEVLESSSARNLSVQHDLHHLIDSTLKAKQHLDIMGWCIKHRFLVSVQTRHRNYVSWHLQVCERQSAAVRRAWPDLTGNVMKHNSSSLFIEDALSNLGIEQEHDGESEELDVSCLQENKNVSPVTLSNADGMSGLYPFINLRAAADILFLRGTSDMMVAKQAIFLYYLFDRHWTMPDMEWRYIIDDFSASFGITRHSILESLSFYLLDDHTEHALQEVSRLLPEIAGPETHPKISQVLLQRQRPDIALMVLRCCGHDGFSGYANAKHENLRLVSLGEAITAVRVRVECGLLTAAFMYLRMHCIKAKQEKLKHESHLTPSKNLEYQGPNWTYNVEVLVTELCSLCIRRNLVDRMIELPWNSDEERYLCKCLYANASENPSMMSGSLLVVYYLQRYRFIEAYQVDQKLRRLEDNYSEADEDELSKMRSISHWRAGLVDKSIDLLPETQRLQMKTAKLDDVDLFSCGDTDVPINVVSSDSEPITSSTARAFSSESSLVLQSDRSSLLPRESQTNYNTSLTSLTKTSGSEVRNLTAPSVFQGMIFDSQRSPYTSSRIFSHKTTSAINGSVLFDSHNGDYPASNSIKRASRLQNDFGKGLSYQKPSAPSRKETPLPMALDDANMVDSLRLEKNGFPRESNTKAGARWRSDDSSDDEVDMEIERILGHQGLFLTRKS